MKKLKYIFLLVSLLTLGACQRSQEERMGILKVYNWADYIDEDVLAEFPEWYKEQTGEDIEVIYQVFDINEVMLTKIERGHEDFDVVCPSEYIIERMMRKDMLLPINRDFGETPDYIPNLAPYIQDELNKMSQGEKKVTDYAVAYMWGTAGTLYNTEVVTEEEALECANLWNPKFNNKILMKDSYRDCYGLAIIYANKDRIEKGEVTVEQLMNDNSHESIAKAEEQLKLMKPNIAGWEADFGKEMMTKGKAWMNFTWSGDAVYAMDLAEEEDDKKLAFVIPKEGSTIWFDGWVMPKGANVTLAQDFVDFLCKPEIAAMNMDYIGYTSAIAGDELFDLVCENYGDEEGSLSHDLSYFFKGTLSDDRYTDGKAIVHTNEIGRQLTTQYPSLEETVRCGIMEDFGDRNQDVLEMWSVVKSNNISAFSYIMMGFLFIVAVFMFVSSLRRRIKKRRRMKLRK